MLAGATHALTVIHSPWSDAWLRGSVVLVPINSRGLPILLARELVAVLRSQVTSICCAIGTLLIMDGPLMRFQVAGPFSCDLTGGLALSDARLLIAATIVDTMTLVVSSLGEERGGGQRGERGGQGNLLGKSMHQKSPLVLGQKAPELFQRLVQSRFARTLR